MKRPRIIRHSMVLSLTAAAVVLLVGFLSGAFPSRPPLATTSSLATTPPAGTEPAREPPIRETHAPQSAVSPPTGPPRVDTGQLDFHGHAITVSCASCHANMDSNPALRSSGELVEFHQGLNFTHGQLSCLTCHNAENYNTLRLADGRTLDFANSRTLCAQCHAPQARDYERGVHGGMTGHWDSTRGPRQRKDCIDCHDPHAPKFPAMRPKFKPLDRFLSIPHDSR